MNRVPNCSCYTFKERCKHVQGENGVTDMMPDEIVESPPGRLNLERIDASLKTVEEHWQQIDDELDLRGIGRKDTLFTATVRMRVLSAYEYLDALLEQQMP